MKQTSAGKNNVVFTIGLALFAFSWVGVGVQHFMYLKFVGTLVPVYMPFRLFWAGFTGAAMILAGISFATRIKVPLAALLLSIMMGLFILMLHVHMLLTTPQNLMTWIRAIQDIAITGAALMLTSHYNVANTGKYIYALAIFALGFLHFLHPAFISGKTPGYFPVTDVFDYVFGGIMAIAAVFIIIDKYAAGAAKVLGVLLLALTLLNYVPGLIKNIHAATIWTPFLLELAITAGAFFTAWKSEDTLR
jgi:uncharacterized membrane protein